MRELTLNHEQVQAILPHRDPMLLIDTVEALVPGEYAKASFFVDPEREIFKGHFPDDPVLPGIYTVEATAQAADILLLSLDRYASRKPLFLGINNVSFLKKVRPGETLIIEAKLLSERMEKAIATCRAVVTIDGAVAAETELTLAMR